MLKFDKLTAVSCTTPSKRSQNYQRFKTLGSCTRALAYLSNVIHDTEIQEATGLTPSFIAATRDKFHSYLRRKTHSFVVCPTCYKCLSGRFPKESQKNQTVGSCKICQNPNNESIIAIPFEVRRQNYLIRSRFSQEEALAYMKSNYPEVFI